MKGADPAFNVASSCGGARAAYEMILMAFERGDLASVQPFLSPRSTTPSPPSWRSGTATATRSRRPSWASRTSRCATRPSTATREAELSVRFVGELTSVVRDSAGEIVEGSPTAIKRQKDVWTFARVMGSDDPNWILVATSE
jgi:predicted lipid-binding transport protein (Tim44 family)